MAQQKIELRKIRDFGENISDTFTFIRYHFKELMRVFFAICGVFALAAAVLYGFYNSNTFSFYDIMTSRGADVEESYYRSFSVETFLTMGGYLFFAMLTSISVSVSTVAYMRCVDEKGGEKPTLNEVWNVFRRKFFKVFFYNMPIIFLIGLGFMFCILPGIWLLIVFAAFTPMLVIEDDISFGDAFAKCFTIIKRDFWTTLIICIVIGIITSLASSLVSFSVGLVSGIITYTLTSSIGSTAGVVTSFLNIFTYIFYIITWVSITLIYYSLIEKNEGTGLMNRLNNLGTNNNRFNNTEEQY